ncbi:unnamed protein product, partial [Brenthis ino]
MKFLVVLLNIVIIQAGVIKEENIIENKNEEELCPGVIVNGVYHELEELKSGLTHPYRLAVDYSTNTLFFSYYSLNEKDDIFKSAYINLNTKEFSDVAGVKNGFAQTVDQNNHEVYISGSDDLYNNKINIYKYNLSTKSTELFAKIESDIWNIYFKDILYYTGFTSHFLYTCTNGESQRFKNLDTKVDQFVIDNDDVIFFTNATGLFSQEKDTKDAVLYPKHHLYTIHGLTTDLNGDVYVCMFDGIYKVNKAEISLKKLLDIDNVFELAFDNENNIIYSDATKLIRLKPNKEKAC